MHWDVIVVTLRPMCHVFDGRRQWLFYVSEAVNIEAAVHGAAARQQAELFSTASDAV